MAPDKELIIITGTDSGIGKSLSAVFLDHGYTVLSTYLKEPGTEKSINIQVELKNEGDIIRLKQKVSGLVKEGYRCSCLIHNAAIALGGPIENLPLALYRESLEVNFISIINITQKLIPFLVKSKGTIMLHGSAAGRVAAPFLSPYVATKFALEGLADCLRRELQPYGIKTILLQTGGVNTPIWKKAETQDISFVDEKYLKSMELFRRNFIQGDKGFTAEGAAKKIFKVFKKKKPKSRYIIAKSNFREKLIRILPDGLLDNLFSKMFDMDYGE